MAEAGLAVSVQTFGMEVLSEEEAWSFFRERAGTCVDDMKLNSTAKKVAKECRGLPIALTSVSAVLKDEDDVSIWEDALRQLSHSDPDVPQLITEVYNPLKLSYDWLGSEQAKSMFLLFCLFREDEDIPLEYLTFICMGLGMYKGIGNLKEARNKTRALTKILKSRSLLLDSDDEDRVRMHDVVRDVCIFIAKQIGCIGGTSCTWISSSHLVGERNELLSGSRCHNLRLIYLDNRYDSLGFKFDDAFVEGIGELYVLCIGNYYSLTTLPHPTQSLGKLHILILDSCAALETISVVGELVNLEILICRDCYSIEELPTEMKGLKSLKLLDLTDCRRLQSIGRGIISSLVGLEELKMSASFNRWEAEEREERENASIKELEALINLACLEIDIKDPSLLAENMHYFSSKKIVRFIIRIGFRDIPSKFSKAMRLCLERETRLGDWIEMQLLRDTEYLYLKGGANNVELAKSQNIRSLELEYCESMKNLATTSGADDATIFSSIEHLILNSLPELQEICDGPISSTSFQNLNELKLEYLSALTQFWKSSRYAPHFTNLSSIYVNNCGSLRNLGQLSMTGKDCLPQLQHLSIIGCSMMEQVFLSNDEEATESQQKCHAIFPKLKEVWLNDMPNLTTFYQGIEFPLLQEMRIQGCPKMKSITGSRSAHLDEDDSWHLLCQPQKVSFGGLAELMINDVGSMSIFTLSMAANLVSLRVLCITDCDEMIKVIEDEEQQQRILLFPKLVKLEFKNLPKLVSFCGSKCEVELPSLKGVDIFKCPNMKIFSMGFVATPNLEGFKTDLTTYVGVGVDVAFDHLKKLEIIHNEKPWYDDKISVSLLNGLEKLEFCTCKGGMSLFSSSAVGNLVNLRVLQIEYSDEMLVNVIEDEEEKEDGEVVSSGVLFPKLEELILWSLPNLLSFCQWKCDVELPSLTKVLIIDCPNMEIFSMGFVAAPNLKFVEIDKEEIDATKDLNGALQQHYLARPKKVSFSVEIDYNPFYDHKIHSSIFRRLGELTINKYEGSMSLFTLSVAANLVSLRKLRISKCDEMIKVIEDEEQQQRILVFPKLEILQLQNLPKLVSFCDSKCEVELPSLRKVVIFDCPNMESFSMGLVATPKLEAFTTDLTTCVGVGVDVAFNSLKELEIKWNEIPLNDDKISVSLFSGLEKLEIHNYTGSMSLFSSSAIGNLVNLKRLYIGESDEIVKVIEDEEEEDKVVSGGEIRSSVVFPKLEELSLYRLPNLVRFCEWRCEVELPSLTKLEIAECPNMVNFSGLLQQHYLVRPQKEEEEEESKEEEKEIEEEDEDDDDQN